MTDTAAKVDIDILTAFNRDYIASVQKGNLRRFDEILAIDFLCSNPDGTLVDRAQFLRRSAPPVKISGLVATNVQIRLMGDVAIIHGGTRYLTSAGELHRGRYTDVWTRRNGIRLVVAAHVTR